MILLIYRQNHLMRALVLLMREMILRSVEMILLICAKILRSRQQVLLKRAKILPTDEQNLLMREMILLKRRIFIICEIYWIKLIFIYILRVLVLRLHDAAKRAKKIEDATNTLFERRESAYKDLAN